MYLFNGCVCQWQLEFHLRFMEANEDNKVGLRAFELKLKPFCIRRLKELNTCMCPYYCKVAELRIRWNNMITTMKGIHGRHCGCLWEVCVSLAIIESSSLDQLNKCNADLSHFNGLTDMWHIVFYPVEGDGWHVQKCIKDLCELFGVDMLQLYPREVDDTILLMVQWHNFEMVVHGRTRVVKENKVLHMIYQSTGAPIFVEHLKQKLQPFIVHIYIAK